MFRVLAQQDDSRRINRVKYRRTFNGNIIKTIDEQYIFKVPCGVSACQQCETSIHTKLSWMQQGPQVLEEGGVIETQEDYDYIYILDDSFVSNQIDLIEHFDTLSN